jgi:hypothetical protein
MNIFELTKILNEMNAQEVRGAITDYDNAVNTIAKSTRRRGEAGELAQKRDVLFTKIANIVNQEREMISNNTSEGIVAKFLERAKTFIAGDTALSHENDLAVIRDIMATIDKDSMYKILGYDTNLGTGKRKEVLTPKERHLPTGKFNLTTEVPDRNAIARLFNFAPGTAGPGEVLLGMMFNGSKVTGREKYGMKGDVHIDGTVFEVKRNGTGCIDKGLEKFQKMLKSANGSDKEKIQNLIKQLSIQQNNETNTLAQKVKEYVEAKNSNNPNIGSVSNLFGLLNDEDKKRAVLFGFSELGYKNIIVCDVDGRGVVVTQNEIDNFIKGSSPISSLGINLMIPNGLLDANSEVKTAEFGKIKIIIQ